MSIQQQQRSRDDGDSEPWYEQKDGLSYNELLRYERHIFDDHSWNPDVDEDHEQAFIDRRNRREYHARLFLGGLGYHYLSATNVRGADWITVRNHSEYEREGDHDRMIAQWEKHGFTVVDTVTFHGSVRLYYVVDEEQ